MRIAVFLALLLVLALPAFTAGTVRAADAPDPENTLYLDLDYGRVVIRLRPDLAPNHVARIKHLVRGGFFDGMVFHRVLDGFMAQTGDPEGNGTGGSGRTLNAEFSRTPQVRGVVSMARTSDKNSGDSQFFIVLSGGHRSDLDGKYTAWGEVASGMEFVDMLRKGDSGRDGKVAKPDNLVRMQVAADADRSAGEKPASAELLKLPDAAATARNFSGAEFRCGALAGATVQPALAQLWTHGYLAGYYKAQNKLTFSANAADTSLDGALRDVCTAYPTAFLLATSGKELAKTARELPPATAAFAPASYACKDYVAAKGGADKAEADFAELWGAAFIQGFKNVGQPGLEIPFDARPQLLGAVAGACAKNPDIGFLDLTALVAEKVKLK